MLGLFEKKNKVDNKDVCASKSEMKKRKTAEDDVVLEISEEVLREISGGRGGLILYVMSARGFPRRMPSRTMRQER